MTARERYPWALDVVRWPDESLLEEQDRRRMHFMVPRALWADGPWDEEPDLIRWKQEPSGYDLLMWRNHMGCWCGYVGLPEAHPLHGLNYSSQEFLERLETHHGLTFSDTFEGATDRLELPENLRKLWWLGFDCAHFGDVMPAMDAFTRAFREVTKERIRGGFGHYRETYKTVDDVRLMVEDLAQRCAFVATVARSVEPTLERLKDERDQRDGGKR
jgi:hypothetical protein